MTHQEPAAALRRIPTILVGTTAILFGIGAAPAPERATCGRAQLHVEGDLSASWLEALRQVCADLGNTDDVDPSARLRITPAGAEVIVDVELADGRMARRRVHGPADLRLTLEALVTLPTAAKAKPSDDAAAFVPAPAPTRDSTIISSPAISTLAIEVGAAFEGRIANAPTYLSTGPQAYAGLRVGAWLLGVTGRWSVLETLARNDTASLKMDTVGAGFLVARRVARTPAIAFDVGAESLLVVDSANYRVEEDDRSASAMDLRLGIVGRLHAGVAPLRWTLAIDGELSPSRLRGAVRLDPALPSLPSWSAGLAVGACWSEP